MFIQHPAHVIRDSAAWFLLGLPILFVATIIVSISAGGLSLIVAYAVQAVVVFSAAVWLFKKWDRRNVARALARKAEGRL